MASKYLPILITGPNGNRYTAPGRFGIPGLSAISSVGRAPPLQDGGRGFKSLIAHNLCYNVGMKSGKKLQRPPRYLDYNSIQLSYSQFKHICKGRVPRWAQNMAYDDVVNVSRLKDGTWYGEWRGQTVFWASAWFQIPTSVGERAQKIQEFVESL